MLMLAAIAIAVAIGIVISPAVAVVVVVVVVIVVIVLFIIVIVIVFDVKITITIITRILFPALSFQAFNKSRRLLTHLQPQRDWAALENFLARIKTPFAVSMWGLSLNPCNTDPGLHG